MAPQNDAQGPTLTPSTSVAVCDMIQSNFSFVDWLTDKLGHPLPQGAVPNFDAAASCSLMHKAVTLGSLMVLCQLLGIFGVSCLLFAQPTKARFLFVSLFQLLASELGAAPLTVVQCMDPGGMPMAAARATSSQCHSTLL